jgi:tRNA wybutosine-synthesizing protein 3
METKRDFFQQRKKDILSKKDKSSVGGWDEKIRNLCRKINNHKNYYTTSSCSGRILFTKKINREKRNVVLKKYHNPITFEELNRCLDELIKKGDEVNFKFEPCILHVACRDVESIGVLFEKAQESGWKNSGAISFSKRFVLDIRVTDKIEFPILRQGKLIVNEEFLKIIVKEANEKLKIGWEKIRNLEKIV